MMDLKENDISNHLEIYPNPFTTFTTIELSTQPHTLTLYDIVGNKVREEQVIGTTVIERGDLTKGELNISVTAFGQVPDKLLKRTGASIGDLIFISDSCRHRIQIYNK